MHTFNPSTALGRQRQADLRLRPVCLHRAFLASHGYIVRSCLKQTEKSQIPVRIGWVETKIKELILT